MTYYFKCNKCNNEKKIEQSMSSIIPKNIPCDKCGKGVMNQDFSKKLRSMKFTIPCTFNDAEYKPLDYGKDSNLENYMESIDQ